ncbi:flagellar hook-associated protein FlgK [Rhizobium sp. L1K21]|uniref:flagellar hook-associated protein FlgK n=1 Tax=Rhizobium sp. L1K21 TaxID=2954933 RepID=UPI002093D8D1|nr:flagellar hook-associated protein FlgK [Rhizobium sp. L1K21]MCO6187107.1 flagellar hook-associated protein FlgK [Rhizobium sp. L1K21]
MSLQTALNTAQSIFSNTGRQMQVVSKNISNANNPDYNRREAVLSTTTQGAYISRDARASNDVLSRSNYDSVSSLSGQNTLYSGLERLAASLGGNEYDTSPSAYISNLRNALQAYAALPSDNTLAQTVISDAVDVANSLNATSDAVQALRTDLDKQIELEVADLRSLLDSFKEVNDAIKGGTASGSNVNDELDTRDQLLSQISEIIGVQSVTRANNDMVLYTSDGTVLFEGSPRQISFTSKNGYDASVVGNPIYIDGVAVSTGAGGNTTAQGSLQANLQLRDNIAPTYQSQLDELASGLIGMFSEGANTGLFSWSLPTPSSPATITPGTVYPGLASTISVDPAYNTAVGGDASRLRDGYYVVSNTTGATGYTALLESYVDGMEASKTWDSSTQLNTTLNILDFSSASIGWLEDLRSTASDAVETKKATQQRTSEALSNAVGVSLDEELSLLLDLEQAYKASSKLVSTVDQMLQALLAAAG